MTDPAKGKAMHRQQAIDLIARAELAALSLRQRESLVLDFWSIDQGDAEYASLPDSLKMTLESQAEPEDASNSEYDPLLLLACRRSFAGVANHYLERRLRALGHDATVTGSAERRERCPCCRYYSLPQRGEYDICPVCFWEDDGSEDPERRSGPNRMTLREARENFARLGAVSESARAHVLSDGRERYELASE